MPDPTGFEPETRAGKTLLRGKVALITGARRGIGRCISETFSANGCDLVLCDLELGQSDDVVAGACAHGVHVVPVSCDIADPDQVDLMLAAVEKAFSRLDVLVNNAGVSSDAIFHKMTLEQWNKVLQVNLTGTMLVTQRVYRLMKTAGCGGKIISIASLVASMGNVGQSNYAASKAGIIGMSRSLAREAARSGITVNVVSPGIIQTPMFEAVPEDIRQQAVARIPLGRPGTPQDVANAVLFLASSLSDYMTGKVIEVDGGLLMG